MNLQVQIHNVSDTDADTMIDYCYDNNLVIEELFYDSVSDVSTVTLTFAKTEDVVIFKLKFDCV